jgi:hypothetical protein
MGLHESPDPTRVLERLKLMLDYGADDVAIVDSQFDRQSHFLSGVTQPDPAFSGYVIVAADQSRGRRFFIGAMRLMDDFERAVRMLLDKIPSNPLRPTRKRIRRCEGRY